MAVLSFNTQTTGLVGQTVNPRRCTMVTTDSLATITTAGYLNAQNNAANPIYPTDIFEVLYDFNEATQVGTLGIFTVTYAASTGYSLNAWENPGNVLLPVVDGNFANFNGTTGQIKDDGFLPSDAAKTRVVMASAAVVANHIACFSDVNGTVNDDAATAINGGNIEAGLSGTAGTLASYPATAARGKLILAGVANTGNTNVTISNAAHAQATVVSIPDGGQATTEFIIADSAGTQHITSGSLQVDAGNLTAGASGAAGTVSSFPATAANGSLVLAAVNAGGAFNSTISNTTMAQSTVFTMPDPANAAARFLVGATATPFTSGNFPVASGTGGLMVDSGLAAANIQNKTNIIAATTADIGGAGAGPISVVVAGLTAASVVVASIESSTNTVAVAKCNATATGFDITFTGDPGASCLVNYVAFIAAQ